MRPLISDDRKQSGFDEHRRNIEGVKIKIFEDKSHFICGEPGWEKVAAYILDWYENL